MSAVTKLHMTEGEYLAYDLANDGKHEFYNGDVVAMAGATEAHALVTANLMATLHAKLEGGPCRVYSSDFRVSIHETGAYVYPDLTLVCGKSDVRATTPKSLLNPTLVVEVLFAGNAAHDRGPKAAHYRRVPSLRAYMLVAIEDRRIEVYYRGSDEVWRLAEVQGDVGDVTIPSMELAFPVAKAWAGLDQVDGPE